MQRLQSLIQIGRCRAPGRAGCTPHLEPCPTRGATRRCASAPPNTLGIPAIGSCSCAARPHVRRLHDSMHILNCDPRREGWGRGRAIRLATAVCRTYRMLCSGRGTDNATSQHTYRPHLARARGARGLHGAVAPSPADERASKLAPHHPAPRRGGANRFEDHRRPQRDPEELPPHQFMMMGCARAASSPRSACFSVRSLRALCIHSFGRGRPSAPNAQPHSTFPDAPPLHGRTEDYAHGKKAAFVVVCGA